jgi:hypothetical protein
MMKKDHGAALRQPRVGYLGYFWSCFFLTVTRTAWGRGFTSIARTSPISESSATKEISRDINLLLCLNWMQVYLDNPGL